MTDPGETYEPDLDDLPRHRLREITMGHASPQTTAGYDRSAVTPGRDPAIRLLDIIRPPQQEEAP